MLQRNLIIGGNTKPYTVKEAAKEKEFKFFALIILIVSCQNINILFVVSRLTRLTIRISAAI